VWCFVSGLYAWNGEVLLGDEATVLDVMRIKVADGRELWQTGGDSSVTYCLHLRLAFVQLLCISQEPD
jgi:hypothetical protein